MSGRISTVASVAWAITLGGAALAESPPPYPATYYTEKWIVQVCSLIVSACHSVVRVLCLLLGRLYFQYNLYCACMCVSAQSRAVTP